MFVGQSHARVPDPDRPRDEFRRRALQPTDLWLAAVALACVSATFALLFLTPMRKAHARDRRQSGAGARQRYPGRPASWSRCG
ncbi:MAG: hypothetical protein WDO24_07815 [Pseudomonadota bacterium]